MLTISDNLRLNSQQVFPSFGGHRYRQALLKVDPNKGSVPMGALPFLTI